VSVIACAMAFGAMGMLGAGWNIVAGLVVQASSIVDGLDGDLARVKNMASKFGGVFDAVLDRFADCSIAAGMAWYAYDNERWPQPLLVGLVAAVGFLLVSYSRARLEREAGVEAVSDLLGVASRDVRLLALAIGCVAGQAYWALVIVAAASYATVAWRLWAFRSMTARHAGTS
jgi:phosphatidylglycerophosphate synthase